MLEEIMILLEERYTINYKDLVITNEERYSLHGKLELIEEIRELIEKGVNDETK